MGVENEMQLDPRAWGVTLPPNVTVDLLHLRSDRHARRYLAHINTLERLPAQSGLVLGYLDKRSVWPAL